MIRSLRFSGAKDTFVKDLPIHRHTFRFGPGLNVIFAGNGTGKTTALKTLAAVTALHGCQRDGLPDLGFHANEHLFEKGARSPEDASSLLPDYLFRKIFGLDKSFSRRPGYPVAKTNRLTVALDWARAPVLYVEGRGAMQMPRYFGESPYGTGDELETIFTGRSSSSGQAVMARIQRFVQSLPTVPVHYYDLKKLKGVNDLWRQRAAVWNAWLDKFEGSEDSRPTLLLDEPDLSFAPLAQLQLWAALKKICDEQKIQVIAASHSLFALPYAQVHTLHEGYVAECRSAVAELARRLAVIE